MPFIKDVDRFDATIDALRNSDHVTKEQLDYLDLKLEKKDKWALCYIKKAFAGGICTSSRVEGLHAVQKKYLTSSSSLKKVFESFKKLEKTQLAKFKEEFKLRSSGEVDDILSLKIFKENYPQYLYHRIYSKYKAGIDYIKENTSNPNIWYLFLIFLSF